MLIDTTQIALERAIAGDHRPQHGARLQPRQRQHARLPARRRRLPRRARRRDGRRGAARLESVELRRPARRRPRRCAPTATPSTSTPRRPSSPRTRSSTRPPSQVARARIDDPPDRDGQCADGPLRRARHLRAAASRPSACAWTSPPRTSPTRRPRAAPTAARTAARRSCSPSRRAARRLRRAARQPARAAWAGPGGGGVEVAGIAEDPTPGQRVYDPGHPDADGEGYVTMPNVDPVTEMVDLISASRAYEANVTAMQAAKQMFTKTLEHPPLMPIDPPASPSAAREWQIGSGRRRRRSPPTDGRRRLRRHARQVDPVAAPASQEEASTASQALATGTAAGPDARSSWRSSARSSPCSSPRRSAQGRRGHPDHLPDAGLS